MTFLDSHLLFLWMFWMVKEHQNYVFYFILYIFNYIIIKYIYIYIYIYLNKYICIYIHLFKHIWYPKTQYLTLGPKFFLCNKMTTARRPMDLFEIWDLIPEALVEIYNLAASNQDLKHFSKSDILGFTSSVFMDVLDV